MALAERVPQGDLTFYPEGMDPRDRRTASSYDDVIAQQAHDVAVQPGTSGYFSKPEADLDPRIFDGKFVKPRVRRWVLTTLYDFWDRKGYKNMLQCTHVWFAGSGITYQWAAQRDPGDLDVLIGIDARIFMMYNPTFMGRSEDDIATVLNNEMKAQLWPSTEHWNGFEVTFYINPGTGSDIRNIHPYAAYDVTDNHWTVPPPQLPIDYDADTSFPVSFKRAVRAEWTTANMLINQYESAHAALHAATSMAARRNAEVQLRQAVDQGAALFNSIHSERHNAFTADGKGYADYYNYRWQAHKQSGVVPALHALAELQEQGRLVRDAGR